MSTDCIVPMWLLPVPCKVRWKPWRTVWHTELSPKIQMRRRGTKDCCWRKSWSLAPVRGMVTSLLTKNRSEILLPKGLHKPEANPAVMNKTTLPPCCYYINTLPCLCYLYHLLRTNKNMCRYFISALISNNCSNWQQLKFPAQDKHPYIVLIGPNIKHLCFLKNRFPFPLLFWFTSFVYLAISRHSHCSLAPR